METKFPVVDSNLVIAYEEIKMFALLPQLYPQDFVDFFICNYFWFLDDVFHKWLENFHIEPFHYIIHNIHPDLKFIFQNLSKYLNFLDVNLNLQIVKNNVILDIYHKPTNSLNYLTYTSCHPPYTKNNIWLSLAKRIVGIASNNKENRN